MMNAFIFVSIVCMGPNNCTFVTSNTPVTSTQCQQTKQQFLTLPFKPGVTMAAAQCLPFEDEKART